MLKALLKWRRRAYSWMYKYEKEEFRAIKAERSLEQMRKRFDSAIKHNVYLSKEIDNQYKLIENLKEVK